MYDIEKDWTDPYVITDPDGRLVAEFKNQPVGLHSAELQRVLLKMRLDQRCPNYILVCRKPHKEWLIGKMKPPAGTPIEIEQDPIFTSIEEAEWEVFKRWWKILTGVALD